MVIFSAVEILFCLFFEPNLSVITFLEGTCSFEAPIKVSDMQETTAANENQMMPKRNISSKFLIGSETGGRKMMLSMEGKELKERKCSLAASDSRC